MNERMNIDYMTFLIRFYFCLEFLTGMNNRFYENNSKAGRVAQPVIPLREHGGGRRITANVRPVWLTKRPLDQPGLHRPVSKHNTTKQSQCWSPNE